MRFAPVLLQMFALALTVSAAVRTGQESFRIVVTFLTAKDNNIVGIDLGGARVVKQYGRRLVLDLGQPFDLEVQRLFFMAKLKSVQSVEIDALVGLQQLDISQIITADTLDVTKLDVNATGPDVDAAYVSSAGQTPLWNLMDSEPYSIHAEGVWQVTNSTLSVVVAVVDTGMAVPARGMFLNLLEGYDFISDEWLSLDGDERDPDATDPGDWGDTCPTPSWHGTKVASILAARHDNEWGMKGVAQNCSVMPVRVLGLCRMGYASDVSDAVVWAAGGVITGVPNNTNPAKIISLSLAGKGSCPDYFQSAVNQAAALGAIIVSAAGNNNQNVSGYFPANCEGVVAVAASTRDGTLAGYSNWGGLIAVSAPGGDSANAIMTLSVDALETGLELVYGMGTSFAVPHVAGIAALIFVFLDDKTTNLRLGRFIHEFTKASSCYTVSYLCGSGISSAEYGVRMMSSKTPLGSKNNTVYSALVWDSRTEPPSGYYCTSYDSYPDMNNVMVYSCFSTAQCACIAGYYYSGCGGISAGSCYPCAASCPAGQVRTKCTGGNSDNGYCSACPAGKYKQLVESSTCTPCDPGFYSSATACQGVACCSKCAVGTYSDSGAIACNKCIPGYGCWTTSPFSCAQCTEGTYTNSFGVAGCANCPTGKFNNAIASTDCTVCDAGKYAATEGSVSCASCVGGTYSSGVAASVCLQCSAGFFSSAQASTQCGNCLAGKYSPVAGLSGCLTCAPGTFNTADASSKCNNCIAGTYSSAYGSNVCASCSDGFFSLDRASSCRQCQILTCPSYQYKVDCKHESDTTCDSCYIHPGPPPDFASFTDLSNKLCPWVCDQGYYKDSTTGLCVPCTTSSTACLSGQYRQQCSDGIHDGACVDCTNAPINTVYTGRSKTYATSDCPYDCAAPYIMRPGTDYCCPTCQNGNYNLQCTKTSSGSCAPCNN